MQHQIALLLTHMIAESRSSDHIKLTLEVAELLDSNRIGAVCRELSIPQQMEDSLISGLSTIQAADTLALLDSLHRRMFVEWQDLSGEIASWPTPDQSRGRHLPPLFYAYLFLSGIRNIRQRHADLGIPREITLATLADIKPWLEDYRKNLGHYGLRQLPWLYNHYSGKLFQLGRLQYLFEKFDYPYYGYRQNVPPFKTVLMAAADLRVSKDGSRLVDKTASGFTTSRKENKKVWEGHLLTSTGRIERSPVCLTRNAWQCLFVPGDPGLSVHITATGPIHPGDCLDSHQQAQVFFKKYYPDYSARCFMCSSWLLDPALEQYLPSTSNIIHFQKTFLRFPIAGADDSQFRGLYPEAWSNPPGCQPSTTLQKAILSHLRSGRSWFLFGGVVNPSGGGIFQS